MDCLKPILQCVTWLWNFGSEHLAYIHNLDENLQKLRAEKDALEKRRNDFWRRVEVLEQQPGVGRTEEVEAWLASAQTIIVEVNEIINEGYQELQNTCVGGFCPKNLISTYNIGKRIIKKIDSVKDLLRKGEPFYSDSAIVVRKQLLLMPEWPLEDTVGLDLSVERVWRCTEDENIELIRLCGTGGVGKTTLLKKVCNEFHRRRHDFDAVIWVEVPTQEDCIEKVRDHVRKKLYISDAEWNQCSGEHEKEAQLYSVLKGKKFVLLLDNVWQHFDLQRLGIPLRRYQNQFKVIITTRSLQLQLRMSAEETIEVKVLPEEQALSLFRMTVGETRLSSDPDLSELANTSAKRCGGLPLALITVAGAMARQKTLREWRYTDDLLRTNPWEIANMGGRVLPLLKFSYDSLDDDITKNCFLYCSIFPEGYNIRIDELTDLWIGEGFLDEPNPCGRGESIVGILKRAYLLENDESEQCVRMHDILRHMALWLARDQGKNKNKVLVGKTGSITVQELTKWKEANRISLSGCRVNIDHSPSCRYLSTLLLRDAQLESFPSGFLDSMPALKVLDLSGNQGLEKLPSDIGNVNNLQYLNLSSTSIAELPTGLRKSRKLKCLLLDYTKNLKWIPKEVISDLSLLQVYSKMYFGSVEVVRYDEVGFLEVLGCLNHINKICITIFSAPSLEKILKSDILRSCIRKLAFMECTGLESLYFREDLTNLEKLELFHCGSIKEFKVSEQCKLGNLSKVYIAACPLLLNLNSLAYARKLAIITIVDCESLMEVTSENMAFPGLKTLSLTRLQNLKSICPSPRCFPALLEIEASECPWLKQLPFDLESANSLLKIRGETEWWDGLIWDGEAIKEACRLKFVNNDHAVPSETISPPFRGHVSALPGLVKESFKEESTDLSFKKEEKKEEAEKRKISAGPSYHADFKMESTGLRFKKEEPKKEVTEKKEERKKEESSYHVDFKEESKKDEKISAGPSYQFNLEDIKPIKVIGTGTGGIVQLVKRKRGRQCFALKTIRMNIEESVLQDITRKLNWTQFLQCPYLVVCYESFYDNGAISVIMEYMDGGSLADFLQKVKCIPEPYLAAICNQLLEGFMFLHHEEHIIHRDIKPSNLLINNKGEVKITDLWLSTRLGSTSGRANTFVGTYNYMSPERIMGSSYDITADIWSLGLVLLECATGKFPYSPPEQAEGWANFFELMEEIVEQPPPCAPADQFSPEFCSFISACLQKDPKERKSSHELLALPFLSKYDDLDVDLSSYFTNAGLPPAASSNLSGGEIGNKLNAIEE